MGDIRSQVILVPCSSYDREEVYEALKCGMELLLSPEKAPEDIIKKDESVLLKLNLLRPEKPEKAVTTHPAVFEAMIRYLMENGYNNLFYGDSPSSNDPEKAALVSGAFDTAEKYGVKAADFSNGKKVPVPSGSAAKEFHIANACLESDALINMCKMKTHGLERITGAVKNLYGCIYGTNKTIGHARYPSAGRFAAMLAELNRYIAPRFTVMDGISAMDGNGPANGNPFHMGVLLFGFDPVAIDSVFSSLVYLDPALVPTNIMGMNFGIGTWKSNEISVITPDGTMTVAEAASRFGKRDFNVDRGGEVKKSWRIFAAALTPFAKKPSLNKTECIRCGICEKCCPAEGKAVKLSEKSGGYPEFDFRKCIRCFCCQEMCPRGAIEIKRFF
ncbi:MAG: DUF362 domain-containing protein [Lachnospiraceae bacterium]|jgi:uncharacterized protein (DUF362 family)/Pyruvate/2-oxoacid:ferredoxin oxidoreductase delta subunit